jgi:hypothetical protein
MNKSRPVLITFSILAGLQILTAGAALSDVLGDKVAGLVVLAVAAVQAGMSFYVQNQVVPVNDTAAYVDTSGNLVAGPASPPSVVDGESVAVIASSP